MAETHQPMARGLLGLHALTALHPGAGTALGTVDLPVQRERHTSWPNIAGSALKGILRDACREQFAREGNAALLKKERFDDKSEDKDEDRSHRRAGKKDRELADAVRDVTDLFGPPAGQSAEHAGAVSITDARLLAYPVRSLKGVFAWVTCPAVLERFARDAALAGETPPTVDTAALAQPLCVIVPKGCPCAIDGKHLLLEEFKLDVVAGDPAAWAKWVADYLLSEASEYAATRGRMPKQLVIAHDDDFTHFAKYATEITARIGLDYETKTVKDGALFYQEFLPTETLFYSVVLVNQARTRTAPQSAAKLLDKLTGMVGKVPVLQIGGDETTGKGFCSVRLYTRGGQA